MTDAALNRVRMFLVGAALAVAILAGACVVTL